MMEPIPPPDRDAADREVRPILHDEIEQLPSKLRDAIVLCYLQGLTIEVAAGQLGCPPSTLKSRLAKARELLRARLARRGLAASVLVLLLCSMTDETSAAVPEDLVARTISGGSDFGGLETSGRVVALVLEEEAEVAAHGPGPLTLALALILLLALIASAAVRYAAPDRPDLADPVGPTTAAWLPSVLGGLPGPGAPRDPLRDTAGHCRSE